MQVMGLLLVLLLALAWSCVTRSSPMFCNKTRQLRSLYKDIDDWDHFVFVQQYPAGVCLYRSLKGSSVCSYPKNANSWTMHGLWPTMQDTEGPNFCNKSAIFDGDNIKDLVPRLNVDWTNLLNNTAFESFWCHEWCKHGTCSTMPDEHTYFATVLDYYDQMMFGDILLNQSVRPSNDTTYSVKDILNAFKQELGVFPYSVNCMGSHKTGAILTQIGVCLDKNLKVIECPRETNTHGCDGHSIYYPTSIYT